MNTEDICDLPMIRAEYCRIEHKNRPASNGFRIQFWPDSAHSVGQIDIEETSANQFAAELEVLAAPIRAQLCVRHNQTRPLPS